MRRKESQSEPSELVALLAMCAALLSLMPHESYMMWILQYNASAARGYAARQRKEQEKLLG
jgi:hypothetical protein